jgi:hypothetical protein
VAVVSRGHRPRPRTALDHFRNEEVHHDHPDDNYAEDEEDIAPPPSTTTPKTEEKTTKSKLQVDENGIPISR